MSAVPQSLLVCFVFAFILTPAVTAQPPAPMPEEFLQDDRAAGIAALEGDDTGWVDEPALTLVPRWLVIPWMSHGPQAGADAPVFGNTEYGAPVTLGDEHDPATGYPHRIAPPAHYGLWYRPEGYANEAYWNQPYSFNPRGYGVPQHRTAYKLDYAPHVLSTTATQYGPYYYPRFRDLHDPLYECDDDCCYSKTCRKRSFWLLDW